MFAHIVQRNDNLPGVVATVLALPRPVHSVVLFVRPTLLSVSSQPKAPQRYCRAEDGGRPQIFAISAEDARPLIAEAALRYKLAR